MRSRTRGEILWNSKNCIVSVEQPGQFPKMSQWFFLYGAVKGGHPS